MGMQDRDYYWEDRKKREKKHSQKLSKSFESGGGVSVGRRMVALVIISFLIGAGVSFFLVMVLLNLNPDLLYHPFDFTKKLLFSMSLM
ncbi:hypothetical protein [Halomonas salina]|uniref:hypothetical protein n=1 Tax=Halomonas salina TaxID=42565 RepID=UPI0012684205|nr:hypothetical protein [Halomonas salina]